MSKPPWFKFYSADWLSSSDIRSMSLEEMGLFVHLMAVSWQETPPGTLPEDLRKISEISGQSFRKVSRIFAQTLEKFWKVSSKLNGRRVNEKMFLIAEELIATTEKQSEAGKRGAEARWGGHSDRKGISDTDTDTDKGKNKSVPELEKFPPQAPPDSKASKKKRTTPKLTDEEWIGTLPTLPAFSHIDVPHEIDKMDAWVAVNPRRKKTRRFITNWLNRIDKPMEGADNGTGKRDISVTEHFYPSGEEPSGQGDISSH